MVTDEQARGIALFFLFSLMDEKTALAAAHKAVAAAKASAPRTEAASETAIVTVLRKTFDSHRKQLPRNKPIELPTTSWKLPKGVDVDAWTRFHKDSSDAEIVAVVLAKILRFSEDSIAEGLNVSLGTLRYRIGKGVRQLGVALTRTQTGRA